VFNRLFPQLIEEGRVYQTVPPLFEVRVGPSSKNQEVIYVTDEADLARVLKKLEKDKKTFKIERNKGLGEMEPESFYATVLDPERRTLRRITIQDAAEAEAALILTMGDNSQERKDFMGDNFQVAIDSGLVEGFEEGVE
jgi:DNA gyrase subunit B